MLLLVAAAAVLVASPPEAVRRSASTTAQARAIVRIVSAVRLSFDGASGEGAPRPHQAMIRTQDARLQPAQLIEFE